MLLETGNWIRRYVGTGDRFLFSSSTYIFAMVYKEGIIRLIDKYLADDGSVGQLDGEDETQIGNWCHILNLLLVLREV